MYSCKMQSGLLDICGGKGMERPFEHTITINIPLAHENLIPSSSNDEIFLTQRNHKTDTESG